MSVVALLLNYIRNRRLIVAADAIIFKNRFHERRVDTKEIEWMHVGRERFVRTSGAFQVIVIKLRKRRRLLRIRVGRYEKEKDLVHEMHRIAGMVPRRKRPRWRTRRFTDR